jgi:hypothetical protein
MECDGRTVPVPDDRKVAKCTALKNRDTDIEGLWDSEPNRTEFE